MKDAEHVDVEDPLERLGVDLGHRPVTHDAGVGHDDVDAAEPLDGAGGGRLHRRQVAHVGHRGQHPVLAQLVGERRQVGLVEIGEDELGALGGQPARDLGADPRAPPVMKTTWSRSDVMADNVPRCGPE